MAALALGVALGALAARSTDDRKAARRKPYENVFPAGEGQAIAERWCLICHTATLVTQQAKDSMGWERTIAQMETWGVKLAPAEHDTLRRYLLGHYGPRLRE